MRTYAGPLNKLFGFYKNAKDLKHVAGTFGATLTILLGNIGTGILCARFLGPEGRGEQAAMIMWPQLLGYALIFGLPSALIYRLKTNERDKSELFSASILLGFSQAILAAAVGIVLIPVWLGSYDHGVVAFAQMCMLITPLVTLTPVLESALKAENEHKLYNRLRLLTIAVTLLAISFFVLTGRMTPHNTALAYLLASMPSFFLMVRKLIALYQPKLKKLKQSVKRLTGYGIRSAGIDLLGTVSDKLDQALIIAFLSPAQMGLYVVALSLSRMLNIFQSSIVSVLFPKMAGMDNGVIGPMTLKVARISFGCSILAALVLMAAGSPVLQLLYGKEYLGSVGVYRILLLEVVLHGTIWILAQAFMSVGRPGVITLQQMLGVGLNIPLMLFLIPKFGITGAALSLLTATSVRMTFILIYYKKYFKLAGKEFLAIGADIGWLKAKLKQSDARVSEHA